MQKNGGKIAITLYIACVYSGTDIAVTGYFCIFFIFCLSCMHNPVFALFADVLLHFACYFIRVGVH